MVSEDPSVMDVPILLRLKSETQPIHADLEGRLDVLNHVRTASDYRTLLETLHGLYCPLESEMGRSMPQIAPWLPDIGDRMRTASLRSDLRVLGNVSPETLPSAPIPALQTLSALFGCLYVLEGSTLGGQVISRQVFSLLNYTAESGCSFFTSYGAETGAMWSKFRHAIESYATLHPENRDSIIHSAIATFRAFGDWIEREQS